jgi:hypothetical protein
MVVATGEIIDPIKEITSSIAGKDFGNSFLAMKICM